VILLEKSYPPGDHILPDVPSFFLIDRVRNQCLVRFPANVRLEPGVNDGAKRPLSQCQRRREAPIITVSRASPSRLGLRRGCARASPSRLGLRPRSSHYALTVHAHSSGFALTTIKWIHLFCTDEFIEKMNSYVQKVNEFIYFVRMNSYNKWIHAYKKSMNSYIYGFVHSMNSSIQNIEFI